VFNLNSVSQSPTSTSSNVPAKQRATLYFELGFICALVSIFLIPEIFGSVAIIFGAYTWRLESSEKKRRGLLLVIFGIMTMLVGIYYTSYFGIYNILPQ
jgi:hypothetical protein